MSTMLLRTLREDPADAEVPSRVLVDDRPLSAGVKFTDAELIGIPRAVVIGRRLADGYAEVRDRRTGDRRDVPLVEVRRVIAEAAG
jgi:prolyl-tRNA synthetase